MALSSLQNPAFWARRTQHFGVAECQPCCVKAPHHLGLLSASNLELLNPPEEQRGVVRDSKTATDDRLVGAGVFGSEYRGTL